VGAGGSSAVSATPRPTTTPTNTTAAAPVAPGAKPVTPVPVPVAPEPPKPDPAIAAAAERLEVARAKIASNVLEPALGDLRQIVKDFPGSAAAADASYMTAELLEKMGRLDDAMAAHVEFDNRFPSDKRAAASRLRLAELMLRSKQPNKDNAARDILAKLISAYPGTPQALQGLQTKIRIDGERRQRELDPVLNVQVPAVLPTLRTLTEQFPTDPSSMTAFNRLAGIYEDMDQYDRAAQALTALATNFPNNSLDAWFRAGEIYERRLKDVEKARAAFEKVPQGSAKYRDAQRTLQRK
jgi:TolA-binding protein